MKDENMSNRWISYLMMTLLMNDSDYSTSCTLYIFFFFPEI